MTIVKIIFLCTWKSVIISTETIKFMSETAPFSNFKIFLLQF